MSTAGRVVFIAGDPGGANVLLPIIQAWRGPSTALGYRQAVKIFRDAGIETTALDDSNASVAAAEDWLEQTGAALLFGGTSTNGVDWERHFFLAARARGIPSIALLDYWSNYPPRFSLEHPLDALPDTIAIMDERARDEMMALGFPADRLAITGHPVLDQVREWRMKVTPTEREQFRQDLGVLPGQRAFLFISQPLREVRQTMGWTTTEDDEYTSLSKLISSIMACPMEPRILLIKTHPRESAAKFDDILPSLPCPARVVDPAIHRWKVCLAADTVFGVSSMLLEEARAMGCQVRHPTGDAALDLPSTPAGEATQAPSSLPLATPRITQLIAERLGADVHTHDDSLPRN
jgi:hypothetical protein